MQLVYDSQSVVDAAVVADVNRRDREGDRKVRSRNTAFRWEAT